MCISTSTYETWMNVENSLIRKFTKELDRDGASKRKRVGENKSEVENIIMGYDTMTKLLIHRHSRFLVNFFLTLLLARLLASFFFSLFFLLFGLLQFPFSSIPPFMCSNLGRGLSRTDNFRCIIAFLSFSIEHSREGEKFSRRKIEFIADRCCMSFIFN